MLPNKVRHLKLKHELELAGKSLATISGQLGVSHSAVYAVTTGRSRSHRISQAIAEALDHKISEIWPEYGETEVQ